MTVVDIQQLVGPGVFTVHLDTNVEDGKTENSHVRYFARDGKECVRVAEYRMRSRPSTPTTGTTGKNYSPLGLLWREHT